MNRKQRRAMAKRGGVDPELIEYVASYRCPDCSSTSAEVTRDRHGIYHATILHDPTCPGLTGVTR